MRAFFGILGLAGAGFLLSSVTSTVGCGSSSNGGSSGSTGSAGSTGHGGSTGTAGTTGTGGASSGGTGGGGGSGVALGCATSDPPPDSTGLIADFMTLDAGAPVLAIGGTFVYPNPGGPMAMVTDGAWHIQATTTSMTAAQYWGAGIYFNGNSAGTDCVDATNFVGIQFDIKGTLTGTGCSVQYSTNDSAHSNHDSDPKGAGDSTSYAPQLDITSMITATTTTIKVPFTGTGAPSGGSPALAVSKDRLTGAQWQLTTPASMGCMLDLTIDNVKFYQ
ncbi:MAG TPA: hypothetical protein VIF57_19415 [Polyangia bacterium]